MSNNVIFEQDSDQTLAAFWMTFLCAFSALIFFSSPKFELNIFVCLFEKLIIDGRYHFDKIRSLLNFYFLKLYANDTTEKNTKQIAFTEPP